jgi:hypothetical protein
MTFRSVHHKQGMAGKGSANVVTGSGFILPGLRVSSASSGFPANLHI